MSLINEALKKAQRVRTEDPGVDASSQVTSARVSKRKEAPRAQTMVLIGAGALVLIVVSVVITVWLVNRPTTPAVAKATTSTPAKKAGKADPVEGAEIVKPVPVPPAANTSVEATTAKPVPSVPAPEPARSGTPSTVANPSSSTEKTSPALATSAPAPTPVSTPAAVAATTAPASTPSANTASPAAPAKMEPATPVSPSGPAKPNERVSAFVDSIRVMGIRSSGNESRVLMNDRVFKVNDMVERVLGVKLVKVEADNLTFADANGVTYVKNF